MRFFRNIEIIVWLSAIAALGVSDPNVSHFTICPLHWINVWCPGCGLGRSVSYILHGDVSSSLGTHWLGIPALVILVVRIYTLSKNCYLNRKNLT